MTPLQRALKGNGSLIAAVLGLMVLASAVGLYILHQQRLRLPFLDGPTWTLKAEFSTAQAVVPGQGQTVRVSGIRIGDITRVQLHDGRAVVTMQVDRTYRDLVRRDATALLRPRTGLKDMFIELSPGHAPGRVPDGFTMPVSRTLPDVNTDEILAMLDADTRDYVRFLLHDLGRGLDGRGATLAALLRRLEPTHRDLAKVTSSVATRQAELRRLVDHLSDLNGELARNDDALASLVSRSSVVFSRLGTKERKIAETVRDLPAALRASTLALERIRRFAEVVPAATTRLRPVAQALTAANRQITPAARANAPVLRGEIRPFVRAARPLLAELRAPTAKLNAASDDLLRGARVVDHFLNMLAHNPGGRQGPDVQGRDEGFLFWLAWVGHQGVNVFNTADAHGTFRAIGLSATCETLKDQIGRRPETEFLLGLSPLITSSEGCGSVRFPTPSLPKEAR